MVSKINSNSIEDGGITNLPLGTGLDIGKFTVGNLQRSRLPVGSILQVQQFHRTSTFVTSGGFNSPGLDVTITPTATTSRIMVMITCCLSTNATTMGFIITRNGTQIALADAVGGSPRVTMITSVGNNVWQNQNSFNFIDLPATTAALTYGILIRSHDGREIRMNRSASLTGGANLDDCPATSTITVMEIAG